MSTSSEIKQQVVVLICKLEETKEAERKAMEEEVRRWEQERKELEQRLVEEVCYCEEERREEEACTESEWQAAEEWCCLQVRAEVAWWRVVIEVPTIDISEFQELVGTLDVDQEVVLS